MSPHPSKSDNMIVLVEHEAFAAAFKELYTYGMGLINEASDYFSGEGKEAARLLEGETAVFYSVAAKRLSYRLMQIASWLLLERAMREQDMTADMLAREKKKVVLDVKPVMHDHPVWHTLPERFRKLSEESLRFVERVRYLECETRCLPQIDDHSNPVSQQLSRLKDAFGGRAQQ